MAPKAPVRHYIVTLASRDDLGHDRIEARVAVATATELEGELVATQIAASTHGDDGYMPTSVRSAWANDADIEALRAEVPPRRRLPRRRTTHVEPARLRAVVRVGSEDGQDARATSVRVVRVPRRVGPEGQHVSFSLEHENTRETECFRDGCDATVVWACTEKDNRLPLNRRPDPQGRFVIVSWQATGHGMSPVVHFLRDSEVDANQAATYSSHYDDHDQEGP